LTNEAIAPVLQQTSAPAVRAVIYRDDEALRHFGRLSSEANLSATDPRWLEVMAEGLGHQPFCLAVHSDERLTGLLPLSLTSSLLFGKHLVSLPYVSTAGIAAADADSQHALLEGAVQLADALGVRHLQLRHETALADERFVPGSTDKVHMRLALPGSTDELWKSFDPKVRNQVRKAEKQGLAVEWGGESLLDRFYEVFAQNMRDLGSPVFPRKFFAAILRRFGDDAELCVIGDGGIPIAAGLLVHSRGSTLVPSAASLRSYNARCPNMLLYWQLLARATERGQALFDFGRSSLDSNTYRFKAQWGATPSPTAWQYYLRRGSPEDLRPQRGGFQLATRLWKKLPVAVTRWLGPPIVCGLPI
jgi:FemAB-related protein (PEP-CTERM system-associated)